MLVPFDWMPAAYSGWLGDASRDELAVRLVVVVVVALDRPDDAAFATVLAPEGPEVCRNRIDRIRLCAWELLLLLLLWELVLVDVDVDGPPPSIIVRYQYGFGLWSGPWAGCALLNLLTYWPKRISRKERKGKSIAGGRCVSLRIRLCFTGGDGNERNGNGG